MRRDRWHLNFDEFQAALERSKKDCADLHRMNEFILTLAFASVAFLRTPSFFDENRNISERYSQSLVFTTFLELFRNSHHTLYLSSCGLYKNAYHNMRYALELMVQSSYIDSKYPNADFPTKIEILKKIEGKWEYRGSNLIDKLTTAYKGKIKNEYQRLSKKVHSSHRQLLFTAFNFMDRGYSSVYVDCSNVSNIYDSMTRLHGIFFLLFLTHFPEIKKVLVENEEFVKTIKDHNLILLSKVLRM